jgi:hypothetical protein
MIEKDEKNKKNKMYHISLLNHSAANDLFVIIIGSKINNDWVILFVLLTAVNVIFEKYTNDLVYYTNMYIIQKYYLMAPIIIISVSCDHFGAIILYLRRNTSS